MKTGIVMQIGIYTVADYAYLSEPNWQQVMRKVSELKHVPPQLHHIKDWKYIGVDCDVASIAAMSRQIQNAIWCPRFITGKDTGHTYRYSSDAFEDITGIPFGLSAPNVFIHKTPLSDFLKELEISHLDVLAVDIEGSEVELFENYDWQVKPTYLPIEFHHKFVDILQQDFEQLFYDAGYIKIHEEPTNHCEALIPQTTELQFLYDR